MVKRSINHEDNGDIKNKCCKLDTAMDSSSSTKSNAKNFYGTKKPVSNNLRWTSKKGTENTTIIQTLPTTLKKDIKTPKNIPERLSPISYNNKKCSPKNTPKRFYKRNDIYWTPNLYGKTRSNDNIEKPKLSVEIENMANIETNKSCVSIDTQTSFSSSVDTTYSSPFMNTTINEQPEESILTKIIQTTESNNIITNDCENSAHSAENNEEVYEMFNCDITSPHDISLKSDVSSTSLHSPRKTPKKTKTILNYFPRVDSTKSVKKQKMDKSPHTESYKNNSHKQLHFSSKGLSPTSSDAKCEGESLFNLPGVSPRTSSKNKRKNMKNKATPMEQMYIDIGQKDFGHVKCDTCGMVYTKAQEEDEAQHAKYHQKIVHKLKFNGWKNERVLEEFYDGRIISIQNTDHFMHLKKLVEIREVVDTELGFITCSDLDLKKDEQAFLFICAKKVVGCVIAVPIHKAYPVIPNADLSEDTAATQSWCCSSDPVKAVCGVSRIWVFSQNRRQQIASRLVDCLRHYFLYGCVISKNTLAFSDPTPNGRVFAEKYVGKKEILVFR